MNNDENHCSKPPNLFNFPLQNMNPCVTDSDDSCIELLDMISMDDNTSSSMMTSQSDGGGIVDSKDDDHFYQEIMSALDKKDFQRIATLALSQSQGGQKIGAILNETMLAIEKYSPTKAVDSKFIEKLTSIIRAQPKNNSSVLTATVAPIRNESIVSSSSPNIANYAMQPNNPGPKSSNHISRVPTSQDFSDYDLQAIFSPDTSKSQGSRSLPATPPISQIPSRPSSSSCLPQKTGESWKLDLDQSYSYQASPGGPPHTSMPFMQFQSQPMQPMMYQNGGYSQVSHNNQYPHPLLTNNNIVCIVSPSLAAEVSQQSMYPGTMAPHNPFMMAQNMQLMSLSSNSGSPCQPLSSTCPMSSFSVSTDPTSKVTPLSNTTSHCNNLPRILPKPSNRIIAPKTQYSSTQQQQQHPQQQFLSQQPPQIFKRPTGNKRTNVRPKSGGSKSAGAGGGRASKAKDNIMMAWEIADQPCEDPGQSFLSQLEAPSHDYHPAMMIGGIPQGDLDDGYDAQLFPNFEDIFEGLVLQTQVCVTTKVLEPEYQYSSLEDVIMYGQVVTLERPPLCRAMVSRTPHSYKALVVVSKPQIILHDDPSSWPPSSTSANNSRMVQLLCAHFGRHSGILSPLLKCLLPQSGDGHHNLSSGPLSVSTEAEDLMIEEDLLADISPVKRDPSHLLNLDRLLESCQPPSSQVSSSSSSSTHTGLDQGHIIQPPIHVAVPLPYQSEEDCLSLKSILSEPFVSWLRKSKHKNKWTIRGDAVTIARSMEVPCPSSRVGPTMLRKKSHFRDCPGGGAGGVGQHVKKALLHNTGVSGEKYRLKMNKLIQENRVRRGDPVPVLTPSVPSCSKSSGLLKIRIQLPKTESLQELTTKPLKINLGNEDLVKREPGYVTKTSSPPHRGQSSSPPHRGQSSSPLHPPEPKVTHTYSLAPPKGKIPSSRPGISIDTDSRPLPSVIVPNTDLLLRPLSIKIDANPPKQTMKDDKKSKTKKSKRKRSHSLLKPATLLSKQTSKGSSSTKRIFCTRKEDRRSSFLHTPVPSSTSPSKIRHSPSKKKRNKLVVENPPLIMKLCSKRPEKVLSGVLVQGRVDDEVEEQEDEEGDEEVQTSNRIKLLIKRNGVSTYRSQVLKVGPPDSVTATPSTMIQVMDNVSEEETYQYTSGVNLAPPSQLRPRPQQAVLQFSPTHSSSDSDEVGVAHNEISSLLQRQEQREPLSSTVSSGGAQPSFPSLPVPYLIGCDPTVFMDPHEVELVVVKNSRYKKVVSAATVVATDTGLQTNVSTGVQPSTTIPSSGSINMFSTDPSTGDMFVPGCFVDQDKSMPPWNRSSPSMPVLAPQEPFTTVVDISKSARSSSHPSAYIQSNLQSTHPPPFVLSDPILDHVQQSPLCMAASSNTHNSQYSSTSSQIDVHMPPCSDAAASTTTSKSPYGHPNYHFQSSSYNSSCYLADSTNQSMMQTVPPVASSSKSQMQSPPVPVHTNVSSACSSHITDYSYFHNPGHQSLQNLVSAETSPFPVSSSTYQPISESQLSKSSSKRSSSSTRNTQNCDQSSLSSSSKKRKETSLPSSSSLPVYPNNSDIYNAAVHYSGLDYYGSGFPNIFSNVEQMKLYEQYAREYSLQLGNFCPTMPWPDAVVAEYYKHTHVLNSQPSSTSPSIIPGGLSSSNPLSSLQPADYSNPYSAYAMSQPYSSMYPSFGVPK